MRAGRPRAQTGPPSPAGATRRPAQPSPQPPRRRGRARSPANCHSVGERTGSRTTTISLVTVGFAVSGVFTWLALRNVHLEQVWTSLRESNYWWVIPSVALLAASQGVRG